MRAKKIVVLLFVFVFSALYSVFAIANANQSSGGDQLYGKLSHGFLHLHGQGFDASIGGSLFTDFATFWNKASLPIGTRTKVTRARFYIKGHIHQRWLYKLQYEFTKSGANGLQGAWIAYDFLKGGANAHTQWNLQIGNQFEPFGYMNMVSPIAFNFIGPSLPAHTLSSGPRHVGLASHYWNNKFRAAFGVFGETPNGKYGNGGNYSSNVNVSGRLAYRPYFNPEKGKIVHFGVSGFYEKVNGYHNVTFHTFQNTPLFSTQLIGAPQLADAKDVANANVASVIAWGPFRTVDEYYRSWVNENNAQSNAPYNGTYKFSGYSFQFSYFLTGEHYHWLPFFGVYIPQSPRRPLNQGGTGAWQVAARFSGVNLNDRNVSGGKEQEVTLGVNWIPVQHVKFMLNYTDVLQTKGGQHSGVKPSSVALSARLLF